MKKKFLLTLAIIISLALVLPLVADAQINKAGDLLKDAGSAAYGSTIEQKNNLPKLVGSYIRIFLGLLGVIFTVLLVYGGYLWMTSFGNKERVNKAKDIIVDSIIGHIILLSAYAISSFVVSELASKV